MNRQRISLYAASLKVLKVVLFRFYTTPELKTLSKISV